MNAIVDHLYNGIFRITGELSFRAKRRIKDMNTH